jgi:hypothetical protein
MPSWLSYRRRTKLWSIVLSQLSQASSPSTGKPEPIHSLSWADFVQLVLELTVKAYRAMYQDRIAQRDWEENVFSLRLAVDYLRCIAFDHESSIRVHWRGKKPTERMKRGEQATIEAKEFDLRNVSSIVRQLKLEFSVEIKRPLRLFQDQPLTCVSCGIRDVPGFINGLWSIDPNGSWQLRRGG